MVLSLFECDKFDIVDLKVILDHTQGQNARSFWPKYP